VIIWTVSLISMKRYCVDGDEHVGSIILGRSPSVWSNDFICVQFTVRLIARQWNTFHTRHASANRDIGIMDVKQKLRNGA
jgi:hypothetical protein